jgi:hypothetical protein
LSKNSLPVRRSFGEGESLPPLLHFFLPPIIAQLNTQRKSFLLESAAAVATVPAAANVVKTPAELSPEMRAIAARTEAERAPAAGAARKEELRPKGKGGFWRRLFDGS